VDGNCGYRVVASLLGFDKVGWTQVRRELFGEFNCYPHLYEGVYGSCQCVKEIRYFLSQFDDFAPYVKGIIMPEMRFLISSHYSVVLLFLSRLQGLDFLTT